MPSAHIVVESKIKESFRVSALRGFFNVPLEKRNKHEWQIKIPIESFNWNVGLIVGVSGSGKTTVAKKLFGEEFYHKRFKWDKNASVLDTFPKKLTIQEITKLLSCVGFSSPPSWTKPFRVLSNGQAFRVEMARILADKKKLTVIDEFTSVVDRNVAKIGSFAISKITKKTGKQIICLSCHRDIINWLEPDWIYDMDTKEFSRRRLRRPKIELRLFRTDYKTWQLFKDHHYLTGEINKAARCYVVFWGDTPVAFTSCINRRETKKSFAEHRTVVLPDYQGVGIGSAVSEAMGEILIKDGFRFYSTTSHPAFVQSRVQNLKWRLVRNPSIATKRRFVLGNCHTTAVDRLTCGFEFIGKTDESPQI